MLANYKGIQGKLKENQSPKKMALSLGNTLSSPALLKKSNSMNIKFSTFGSTSLRRQSSFRCCQVKAFFNPLEDPLVKEALKEPVAFMGGMFAGLLRLDLNEDPLKEWVARTVEASGITEEEIDANETKSEEESPQQIMIE